MKPLVLTLCAMLCIGTFLGAEEIIYDCSQDSEVDEELSMLNFGSDEVIEVYCDWEDLPRLIAKPLFQFPIDIEPITYLDQAVLQLHVIDRSTDPGPVRFFRADDAWDEMTVTWDNRPSEDSSVTVEVNAPDPGMNPALWEIDVTPIVEAWLSGDPNHGFYLDVPDNNNWVHVDLATKEHPDADIHPKLWINYFVNDVAEEDVEAASLDVSSVSAGSVTINYNLPTSTSAELSIYDVSGAVVESLTLSIGHHSLTWESESGVYFIRLELPDQNICRKAVIIN